MRLVEHHRVSDAILYAASEHVLVQTIEYERRERLLQVVVLRGVNANDNRLLALPQAFVRFGQFKEAVISQFLQPAEQRPQAAVRFAIGSQDWA